MRRDRALSTHNGMKRSPLSVSTESRKIFTVTMGETGKEEEREEKEEEEEGG